MQKLLVSLFQEVEHLDEHKKQMEALKTQVAQNTRNN